MNYAYSMSVHGNAFTDEYVDDYAGAADAPPAGCSSPCYYFQRLAKPAYGLLLSTQYLLGNSYLLGMNGAALDPDNAPESNFEDLARAQGPFDNVEPSVLLVSPAPSSAVALGSSLTVTADASDNVGVAFVQFQFDLNGDGIIEPATEIITVSAPTAGNSESVPGGIPGVVSGPAGQRTITAIAYDTSYNASVPANSLVDVGSSPAQVTVPNVVGLTQAAATSAITGAGLTVGTVSAASSSTVPSGERDFS